MSQASDPEEDQGGEGLTFVLEITDIVEDLHIEAFRRRRPPGPARAGSPGR